MANFPILEFTDGTEPGTVSLLKPFFKVESRRMTIVQTKDGGTWQSSPLADGRRLVNRRFGNAIETIELSASAATQDSWSHQLQELERLMEKAVEYWTSAFQNTLVYWVDKAGCETNKRYALIYDYSIPTLDQILRAPFASKRPGMVNFSISIERGHWLADPPGDETCVEISGTGAEGHEATGAFSPTLYTDDGSFDSTGTLLLTGASIFMGDAIAAIKFDGIVHFPNITIPQGSIVTSATVTYQAAAADVGAPVFQIKGESSDSAATLSTAANWIARVLTSNAVAWNPGAWVLGVLYPTPDISTIIQEIIDRPGWVSGNDMLIVVEDNGSPVGIHREFESTSGGGALAVLTITYISAADAGRTATCGAEVYIANKHNYRGLTHVWYDDAGVGFSANLLGSGVPYDLLPAVPAVGDILYFGIEGGPLSTITGGGPFFSLVFDLVTAQAGVTFGNGWEFWNSTAGPAFAPLASVQDNTDTGGQPLDTAGVNSVHWGREANWIPNAINGVTAYWIKLEVTAVGAPTPPTQQSRDIYTVNWPYIEIDDGQVGGDIAALLRTLLNHQSRTATSKIGRIVMGLRSSSRGLDFTAYLNCSDQQEIPGIAAFAGGASAFATNVVAPTERVVTFTPGIPLAMLPRVFWTFNTVPGATPVLGSQWYGSYHAFARVTQTVGAPGNFSMRLTGVIGNHVYDSSGGTVVVPGISVYEFIDLGRIDIPDGTGVLLPTDELSIILQLQVSAVAGGGGESIDLYDIILIPVDEMIIDIQSPSLTGADGWIAKNYTASIDSVLFPKSPIRTLIQDTNGAVEAIWRTSGALAFLQSNQNQRLWFLLMDWDTSVWVGTIAFAMSVQAFANRRYLSLRGER